MRGTSAFLLLDERVTLIDTGFSGSERRILAALAVLGRRPADVETILLTHYHPDHMGSLAALQAALGAQVAVHWFEAPYVGGQRSFPPSLQLPLKRSLSWPLEILAPRRPVRVDRALDDGDELPVLGGLRIVHTPGHTRGHCCLYLPALKLLIAGDSLQVRRGRLRGPSRLFSEDMVAAKRSVAKLASLAIDRLAFSHFPPINTGAESALRGLADEFGR